MPYKKENLYQSVRHNVFQFYTMLKLTTILAAD